MDEFLGVDGGLHHHMPAETEGGRGRELVATEFGWERVAKQFVAAYASLAAGTCPPGVTNAICL